MRSSECSSESGLETAIGAARGSPSGSRSRSRLPGVGEAPADDRVEAEVAHHVLGAAAQQLLAGQAPDLPGAAGSVDGQVRVVAVDAADLLDQVDLAGDVVVAVDGHRRPPGPRRRARRRSRAARGSAAWSACGSPCRAAARPARRAGRAAWLRRDLGGDVDRPRDQLRAAELDHQPRGDPLAPACELGVELLLEAGGGLRAQAELARGAQDVDPVPGRDLEQDPGRLLGDLGDLAAHDPGDPRGPVRGRRRAPSRRRRRRSTPSSVVIFSPSLAVRIDQLAARDLVEVEGVQRLRGEQHHVVGDVDDVVDRPLAGRHQPRLQPGGERPDLHVGEDARGEARAELGDLDRDRGVVGAPPLARRLGVLGPTAPGRAGRSVIAWTSRATP